MAETAKSAAWASAIRRVGDNSTRSSAYTSAMFSETRYALNGDLRVAYRASPAGARDIVFGNWFTNCEVLPELPSFKAGSRR